MPWEKLLKCTGQPPQQRNGLAPSVSVEAEKPCLGPMTSGVVNFVGYDHGTTIIVFKIIIC